MNLDLTTWSLSNTSTANTFKLQGSNDNISWNDLSVTMSSIVATGVLVMPNTLAVGSKFKYYRILGVAGVSYYGGVTEVKFTFSSPINSSSFNKPVCVNDTDADGINNHLDLDSDGDGCSDAIEAGSSTTATSTTVYPTGTDTNTNGLLNDYEGTTAGTVNYTSTYTNYALSTSFNVCTDTDGDGIGDLVDLDDDNDGVLDTDEFNCSATMMSKTGVTVSSTVTWGGTLANILDGAEALAAYTTTTHLNQTILQFDLPAAKVLSLIELSSQAAAFPLGSTGTYNIEGWNGTTWSVIAANQVFGTSIPITATSNSYKFNMPDNYTAYSKYRIFGTSVSGTIGGWVQEAYFNERTCNSDVDGDGIPNSLELDSDNDGCADAIEAGSSTTATSTTVYPTGTDANTNGLLNNYEGTTAGSINYLNKYTPYATSASINACLDTDTDGILDVNDIDDDNDGVLDDVECPFNINASTLSYNPINFNVVNGASNIQTFGAAFNALVVNVRTLDNSFNVKINGGDLSTPSEFQFFEPDGAPANFDLEFEDGTMHPSVWGVVGTQTAPLIRVIIDNTGKVSVYGAKTSGGPLFKMRPRNGSFNTVSLNKFTPNTFQIGQVVIGQTYITGDFGVVTTVNVCSDTDGDGSPDYLD